MPHSDDDIPLSDDEWPDPDDVHGGDDDETELVRCGHCGKMIAEDSPQCPHCKTWGPSDGAESQRSAAGRFIWLIVVALMIGIILVVWHGAGR